MRAEQIIISCDNVTFAMLNAHAYAHAGNSWRRRDIEWSVDGGLLNTIYSYSQYIRRALTFAVVADGDKDNEDDEDAALSHFASPFHSVPRYKHFKMAFLRRTRIHVMEHTNSKLIAQTPHIFRRQSPKFVDFSIDDRRHTLAVCCQYVYK